MKKWLILVLTFLATAAFSRDLLAPPSPSELALIGSSPSTLAASPNAVTDTFSYNFDTAMEGWGFTLAANVMQEYYPDPLRGCQEFSRNVVLVGAEHTVGWNSFGGVGALSWTCPFSGWYTNTCNYSWRIKSISVPVPSAWEGAYRIEVRLNKASTQTMYAMIGYKMWGDTIFSYTGWTTPLRTNTWDVVTLTIPDAMTFRNLEAVSILLGAYSASGTVYVDWVKGYKPATPLGMSPANGAIIESNRPVIQWSATADSYDWEYSAYETFKPSTVVSNILSNQYSLPAGLPNGQYYWRVRGYTAVGGGRSNYSKTSSFTIVGDLNVPEEFPTIGAALSAIPQLTSATILVAPGRYPASGNTNLHVSESEIGVTIKSSAGPENTIIDCQRSGSFLSIDWNGLLASSTSAPGEAIVEGLTILNTKGEAIRCYLAPATIRNCIIGSSGGGAGLYVWYGGPVNVSNCRFENNDGGGLMTINSSANIVSSVFSRNRGAYYGGAVLSRQSSLTFTGCLFDSNSATMAGAIYADTSTLTIIGSSFARNSSVDGVSGLFLNGSTTTIQNSLFTLGAGQIGTVYANSGNVPALTCCDLFGNKGGDWLGTISPQATLNGNISLDPFLCDSTKFEPLNVAANSPCLAAYNSCGAQIGTAVSGCLALAMKVSPDSLLFNAIIGEPNPGPQVLSILNTGGSLLRWTAVTRRTGWLALSTQAGTAPSMDTVKVSTLEMAAGVYVDTVEFSVPNTLIPPVKVPVRLRVILPNQPPVIAPMMPIVMNEGTTLSLAITASDADKTIPKLSALNMPLHASFTDSGNGAGAFLFSPDYTQAGHYAVKILAADAVEPSLTDSASIDITVTNTNRLPSFVSVPPSAQISEGDTYQVLIEASDLDNDPLVITCSGLPPQALFADSGNGTASVLFHSDQANAGQTYHLQFSVTDNIGAPVTATTDIEVKVIPLEVVKFEPDIKTGENDVLVTNRIQLFFSKEIDRASLAGNVHVRSAKGDQFSHSYDPLEHRLAFENPRTVLIPLDTITVTLSASLLDLSGHSLGTTFERVVYAGTVVYAGDATNDGFVDERDILPIAYFWESSGPTRAGYPDLIWHASPGHQWSPVAASYADADGSGIVDANDICAVISNWGEDMFRDGKLTLPVTYDAVARILADRDQSVLAAMYEGAASCPESVAKQLILRALGELLKSESESTLPTSFALYQNFPNPFNPTTEISFDLPTSCDVTLEIFSSAGRRVALLAQRPFTAGNHTTRWEGTDDGGRHVASGVYLYRLTAGEHSESRKMLLLK